MVRKQVLMVIAAALILLPLSLAADDMLILPPQQQMDQDQEVTDEQLQMFGISLITIQEIQLEANQEIQQVVEDSALSEERLNEILNLQQADQETFDEAVSSDELEEFEHTIDKLSQIHLQANEDMVEAVEGFGFEIEEFNQLAQIIQEDPALLNRLESMFSN